MHTNSKTEATIIVAATREWFLSSQWSIDRFAHEQLAPALVQQGLVPPLPESNGDEYMRTKRNWGKRVARIFNGEQPFPLEWKWAWLCCLPECHYLAVRRELLAMAGVFDVRLPMPAMVCPTATAASMGEVLREFGEFVSAASPAADGSYNGQDDPAAVDTMMREGLEAMERIASEVVALMVGTGRPLPRRPLQAAFDLLNKTDAATREGVSGHA